MASFRPGVRELDVEAIYGVIRDEVGQKVCGVGADYTHVCKTPSADAVNAVAVVLAGPFDAEEINIRLSRSLIEKKGGLAGTYLNVNGAGTSEKMDKVNFAIQIFRFERDRRIVL